MASGQILEQEIRNHWGKRFHCPPGDLTQEGSLIVRDGELQDSGSVLIYHIGSRSIVRLDPSLADRLQIANGQVLATSISQDDLQVILRLGLRHTARLAQQTMGSYFYLDPPNFTPRRVDFPGILVRIDPETEAGLILSLCQACTAEEVQTAEIDANQPDAIIFGHILDGNLVSYAGFRYWDERFADIGVLTHPLQRGKGLAKAGTSSLCEWCIEHQVIPMYRVEDANRASFNIPLSLGFTKKVEIEVLKVVY